MKKKKEITLNPKQEKFCQLYASDAEFFGNGVRSYLEVYGYKTEEGRKCSYETAKANASRLLTKANILNRINELFEARGLNDVFVDKQLEKLITQDADFKSKITAIKEYNALKQRVVKRVDTNITNNMAGFLNQICGNDTERHKTKAKRQKLPS
jgi:phage terminase small subunit